MSAVTLNLSNAGTSISPLDVNSLVNLTGGTGSAVVSAGGTAVYSVTGFSSTAVGLNNTITASLDAGDQQSLSGANSLGVLSQSVSYSVLGHSNPVLTVASGNNQTIITGGTLNAVMLNLSNVGTIVSPLDVNSLVNLDGSTGTAVVEAGGAASYVVTGLSNSAIGENSITASLNAGDQQSLSGANPLSTLTQSVSYRYLVMLRLSFR